MEAWIAGSVRRRTLGGAILAATCVLGLAALGIARAPSAAAAPPDRAEVTGTFEFVDGISCSFPIALTLDYRIMRTDFFDRAGNFKQGIVHVQLVGTATSNGVTMPESDHYSIHYAPDGGVTQTGLTIHTRLPGGGVFRDAGRIGRNPDGSIALVRGPHPGLSGDTAGYCQAFA